MFLTYVFCPRFMLPKCLPPCHLPLPRNDRQQGQFPTCSRELELPATARRRPCAVKARRPNVLPRELALRAVTSGFRLQPGCMLQSPQQPRPDLGRLQWYRMAKSRDHLPSWLQPKQPYVGLRCQAFGSNPRPTVLVPAPGTGCVLTTRVPGKCSAQSNWLRYVEASPVTLAARCGSSTHSSRATPA